MENGFTTQDWKSINGIDGNNRLVAKFLEPVDYVARSGIKFRIPYCQPTDYASTPPETWGAPLFLIPYGWWSLAAGLHDSAFQNLLLIVNADGTTKTANLTEKQCNDLLAEAMQSVKPNPTEFEKMQGNAIIEGVTLGGWHAFNADRKARQ